MPRDNRGYPHYTNLLFGIPLSGRFLPPEIMFSFHSMAMPMNYNNIMTVTKGEPIDVARNKFAESAMEQHCKYMFFWDEDVACPPQTIPELIYKMEHNPSVGVCGGVYCLKRDPSEPLIFMGNGNGPFWDWKAGEFFECSGIGMGCTIIRTEILKDLKKPWFKTVYDYSRMMDGIPALETWTEDLWFCKRVTDTKKWKVYTDGSLICTHYDLTTGRGYTLPPDSKPLQHLSVQKGSKKVLDIGSGMLSAGNYTCKEGIPIKCDFDETRCETDYRCDLRRLPFGNQEFDIVFSGILETFSPYDINDVLKEWMRIIKPTGELRLVTGNFDTFMKRIERGEANPNGLFSMTKDSWKLRKSAFTKNSLEDILEECGISTEKIEFVPSDADHIGVRISI